MSSEPYTISLQIYQSNPDRGFFHIVEQTVWYYTPGTWSDTDGTLTLTMGWSGSSGVLRFMSDKGELVAIAVGVDGYKRWCDIVPDLKPSETALQINGEYYNDGPRSGQRTKDLSEYSVSSAAGTKVGIKYTVAEGNNLKAYILFG